MEKIQFSPEDGREPVGFFVLEEARLLGRHYLLVADSLEEDGEALVLRAQDAGDGAEAAYEAVEDEIELSAVLSLMGDALDELGIEVV